jgi:hypothetical protein
VNAATLPVKCKSRERHSEKETSAYPTLRSYLV